MFRRTFMLGALALFSIVQVRAAVLFDVNASWRYFKGTTEASPADTGAWRAIAFDDSAWPAGAGPFYYSNPNGVEPPFAPNGPGTFTGTTLGDMVNNYTCVFLRKTVVLSNVADILRIDLQAASDDGFVAWLNGVEIIRYNMPAGEPLISGASLGALSEAVPLANYTATNVAGLLKEGANVFAVQAFNSSRGGSSDFGIMVAASSVIDNIPPTVISTLPSPGSIVNELFQIEITFSEAVTNVQAADLLINGNPATDLFFGGPGQLLFAFTQPPTGTVNVAWAPGHGITDFAKTPNAFAGGSWTYNLNTNIIPAEAIITEFVANNDNSLNDEDGDSSDWLEVYNSGAVTLDLDGWFLTDEPGNLTKWRFPSMGMLANGYLVVFASGKDRTNNASRLHTNFRLPAVGGFLALVNKKTNVVSVFSAYPQQFRDVAYGRDRIATHLVGYYPSPTPGKLNGSGGPGFSSVVNFSRPSMLFTGRFDLTLTTADPNGEIRYTLNGAMPTNTSPLYTGRIGISNTVRVRTRNFTPGLLPSDPHTEVYMAIQPNMLNFTSDLPVVVLNSFGAGAPSGSADHEFYGFVIEPGTNGVTRMTNELTLKSRGRYKRRGSSTEGYPKASLALEFWDEFNNDEDKGLLGMPAESDWVFYAPNNFEPILIHNPLAYEISRQVGPYAARTRFAEVFLVTDTAPINNTSQHYNGIYAVEEKLKITPDRVDIDRLEAENTAVPEVTGGYLLKIDRSDPGSTPFNAAGQSINYVDPKYEEITLPQRDPQEQYIINYFNQFGNALNGPNYTNPTNGYAAYLDVAAAVDHHIVNVFTFNVDALRLSGYFHKPRDGKITFGPVWDFDRTLNSTDGRDTDPRVWRSPFGDGGTDFFNYPWWGRMFTDTNFFQAWIDRYQDLREGVLSTNSLWNTVDMLAGQVTNAYPRELARWAQAPRTRSTTYSYQTNYNGTYAGEVAALKFWMHSRLDFMDTNFLGRPTFSLPPGPVTNGTVLTLTGPAKPGTQIYYTLNGTDPFLFGGVISPAATLYSGPITLTANARVVARSRNVSHRNLTGANNPPINSIWSGVRAATYVVSTPRLVISEIMYNPLPDPNGVYDSDDFEFIELKNVGAGTLSLIGFRLTNGIQYSFTARSGVTSLAPGEAVLLVRNGAAFTNRYGAGFPVAGQYSGSLNNSGDSLYLEGPLQEPIHNFTFNDGWYPLSDGLGFSLVVVNDQASPGSWGDKNNWRSSGRDGGSPGNGTDPAPIVAAPLLVNEALTRVDSQPAGSDLIEIYNPTGEAVDLGGWFLTDDDRDPKKYRIPNGTMIGANGYAVFTEAEFNSTPGTNSSFALGARGDAIWLFSGDINTTNITGYFHGFEFGAADDNVSFGRHVTSTGAEKFVAQSARTFGAVNSGPKVGPVVVSEIMYHPPDLAGQDNVQDEYVELTNHSGSPVDLFDAAHPLNTWRLRNAVDFNFPPGTTLPAGGRLLVVSFSPVSNLTALASFRATYQLDNSVVIVGPWSGKLDNSDETLELKKPGLSDLTGTDYVLVEEIRYDENDPWPAAADGLGPSLQRSSLTAFADDPASWIGSGLSPGGPTAANLAPTVTLLTPVSGQHFVRPTPVVLSATAGDTDGTISRVEYYDGVFKIGEATVAPYVFAWTTGGYGAHSVTARAVDDKLGLGFSTAATIEISSQPPTVSITAPSPGSIGVAGGTLTLEASASDVDGTISNVTFYANALKIGEDSSAPFSLVWTNLPAGQFGLRAVATDDSATRTTSAVVNVSVASLLVSNLTLVRSNSTWRYLQDGTDPGVAWRALEFNDTSWKLGAAQLGWGDNDEATRLTNNVVVGGRTNRIITYYFRQKFVVDTFVGVTNVSLRLQRDDGGVVYLNGNEVFRSNMTNGPINYNTLALLSVTGSDENAMFATNLPPSTLQLGENVIAVEIHQARINDNDASFAADLVLNQSMVGPVITSQPQGVATNFGATVGFTVTAAGTEPLTYRWYLNGAPLAGESGPTLSRVNVQAVDAGDYTVGVSNQAGVALSVPATLTLGSPDTDGDGLPDDWEIANGTDPNVNDANADPDVDGLTNGQEYIAGTNPQDANSVLRVSSIAAPGGPVTVLTFPAATGRTYSVLARDSLTSGAWQTVANVPDGAARNVSVTNNILGSSRFYRIVTPIQP